MANSTLVNHCGAHEVDRKALALIEPPPPTKTWYPLAHHAVLDQVCSTLQGAGFAVARSRLSISHGDARFFATLDLATNISNGVSLAVGIRNSNDQSVPIGFCCGHGIKRATGCSRCGGQAWYRVESSHMVPLGSAAPTFLPLCLDRLAGTSSA